MSEKPAEIYVDWELELEKEPVGKSEYQSPLMSRMSGTRLTSELLQEEVPILRAGEEAQSRLDKATKRMGEKTRNELHRKIEAGEKAKQRLFEAALPLIRTVAKREWMRRQQWGSQVTLEDLTQDATVGFLKGLSSFNLDAVGRSATNYLGQWMLVETRRSAESLDHDLQVGHDAGERFRRIRALRNRLVSELGREPTDTEIAEASRDPNYVTRPGFVGRAPTEGLESRSGKGVTESQVREERAYSTRIGHASRFGDEAEEDGTVVIGQVDPSRSSTTTVDPSWSAADGGSPETVYVGGETGQVIASLFVQTMNRMLLPTVQRDIIARRYGIPPHDETSAREIAKQLGVQRDKVSRVLTAFQTEMTRPGGSFHACLVQHSEEDLRDYGLGWAFDTLGEWKGESRHKPPPILTADLLPAHPERIGQETKRSSKAIGVRAWYECDFHERLFSFLYEETRKAPKRLPCPSCGREAYLLKVTPSG